MIGKEWVAATSLHKAVLNLLGCILRLNARVDSRPDIQRAPSGYRGGPVTTRDLSYIDIDRVFQRIEVGIVESTLIPVNF